MKKIFISHKIGDQTSQVLKISINRALEKLGIEYIDSEKHLKIGDDIDDFMSQLSDLEISDVIMVCSKQYKEDSENAYTGVGVEVDLIRKRLNEKNIKLIPICFYEEFTESIPAFCKSILALTVHKNLSINEQYNCIYSNLYNRWPDVNEINTHNSISTGYNSQFDDNRQRIDTILQKANSEISLEKEIKMEDFKIVTNYLVDFSEEIGVITSNFKKVKNIKKKILKDRKFEKIEAQLLKVYMIPISVENSMNGVIGTVNAVTNYHLLSGIENEEFEIFKVQAAQSIMQIISFVQTTIDTLDNMNKLGYFSQKEEIMLRQAIFANTFNSFAEELSEIIEGHNVLNVQEKTNIGAL